MNLIIFCVKFPQLVDRGTSFPAGGKILYGVKLLIDFSLVLRMELLYPTLVPWSLILVHTAVGKFKFRYQLAPGVSDKGRNGVDVSSFGVTR